MNYSGFLPRIVRIKRIRRGGDICATDQRDKLLWIRYERFSILNILIIDENYYLNF